MPKDLRSAIRELSGKLGEIATLLAQNTRLADEAFLASDLTKLEAVKSNHEDIEGRTDAFEEDCMRALALYQPVARDLRHIMTLFKIGFDLERMSSLSERIARKTQKIAALGAGGRVPDELKSYFHETADLLDETADILKTRDIGKAKALIEQGGALYRLKRRLREQFQSGLEQNPAQAGFYMTLVGIARHLGRLSNLASVICEEIVEYHQETWTA